MTKARKRWSIPEATMALNQPFGRMREDGLSFQITDERTSIMNANGEYHERRRVVLSARSSSDLTQQAYGIGMEPKAIAEFDEIIAAGPGDAPLLLKDLSFYSDVRVTMVHLIGQALGWGFRFSLDVPAEDIDKEYERT